MRVLLQRVSRASVRVDGRTLGEIERGLLVFLGVERSDTDDLARKMADKTVDLRIFSDDDGKMNLSVEEIEGEILVVSQFTLASATRKGRRPSFHLAAPPEEAERLYRVYADALRARGIHVAEGRFQAMMEVELVNDGPVTILLDPPGRGR